MMEITNAQYHEWRKHLPLAKDALYQFQQLHKRLKAEPQKLEEILEEIDRVQKWYDHELS